MYRFPVLQLYIWPVPSSTGFTIWCFPDTIIQVVTVAWQHKLIESSEKYLQYNLNILMEVKDLWLQSDEYHTAPQDSQTCLCSPYTITFDSDATCTCQNTFSQNKECIVFMTVTAVTFHISHSDFHLYLLVATWSGPPLNLLKCFSCGSGRQHLKCCLCLAPATACD